jgi:serine/threonine protein kinase
MTERSPCPGPERLGRLLEPGVSPDDLPELTTHLDDCERCQGVLEGLASAGQTLTALRAMAGEHGSSAGKARPPALGEALAWLEPSEDPEALGVIDGYRIVGILGQGGMGVVYKAFDPSLHRYVAIKVLAPHLGSGAAARKRFEREARAAAAVNHEHVIAIHAVRERRGLPYLVMECIPGLSLQDLIEHEGPIDLRRILRIGMQIASGLAAAHAQGLVHRDIKPANILLENGIDRVKITDFGLARAVDDVGITQSGTVAGTPQYMAPEQAGGEPLDHRADLFSLGSVLYAMCAGQPPFQGDTPLAVIRRVSDREPRPLADLNPDTPDWLVEIVERLHAKRPDDRFQSASEVADLLGQYLAYLQHPNHAPKPKPLNPPKKPRALDSELEMAPTRPRRSRTRIGLAAAAVALAAATGLFFTPNSAWAKLDDFLATVFRMKTANGTLAVTVNDPSIKVRVDGEELLIEQPGMNEFRISPGTYQLVATKDGRLLKQEWITITRDGKTLATVAMEPNSSTPSVKAAPVSSEKLSAIQRRYTEYVRQLDRPSSEHPVPDDQLEARKQYHEALDKLIEKGFKANVPLGETTRSSDQLPLDDQVRAALKLLGDLQKSMCDPGWKHVAECLTDPAKRGQDLMQNCTSCHGPPATPSLQPQSGQPALPGAGSPPMGAMGGGSPPMGGLGSPPAEQSRKNDENLFNDFIRIFNTGVPGKGEGSERANPEPQRSRMPQPTPTPTAPVSGPGNSPTSSIEGAQANVPVTAMIADPQGRWLYAGLRGGWIAKIEPKTWQITWLNRDLVPEAFIHNLAITPDGKTLASATGGLDPTRNPNASSRSRISFWDLDSGKLNRELKLAKCASALAFSPDGEKLAVGDQSGGVQILGFSDLKRQVTIRHQDAMLSPEAVSSPVFRSGHGVTSLAFSPAGDAVATAGKDGCICLWSAKRGTLIRDAMIFPHAVSRIAFAPDGSCIAAAGQSPTSSGSGPAPIALIDARSLRILAQDTLENAAVSDLRYSPDGWGLIAVGAQGRVGMIAAWDMRIDGLERIIVQRDPSRSRIHAAAFSPDNRGFYVIGEYLGGSDDIDRIDWPASPSPKPSPR